MKQIISILTLLFALNLSCFSQVKVSKAGTPAHEGSLLDLGSGGGLILPHVFLTDTGVFELEGDASSAEGLIVYNTNEAIANGKGMYIWDGNKWKKASNIPVEEVTVSPITINFTETDKTQQLTAIIIPENATERALTWFSSNTAVATVDANGLVTARGNGSAIITVKTADGVKTATCAVTVAIPVTGVSLNLTAKNFTAINQTQQLTATVAPSNAANKAVTWSSNNVAVATVDANGLVTAKGNGSTIITVKTADGAKTATCTATVAIPVAGVSLNKTSLSFTSYATQTLIATVTPGNAVNKAVTWSSSNAAVATVDANGLVTARGNGSATITVKTADGAKTATCAVTVTIPVTGVSLNLTAKNFTAINQTQQLTATVTPSNAANKAVTWSSNNAAVATVDANGLVTARGNGSAIITVKTTDGAKTATCTVAVAIPVTGVSLNLTAKNFTAINQTQQLTATVAPSNAANKAVTWSSSNAAIATVDANGLITARGNGSAIITVKTADGAKTATCTATVAIPVAGVSLNKTSLSFTSYATQTLIATVTPGNAVNKAVTWSSSNTAIVTVSASGVVTPMDQGTATITVKTTDGAKTATCSVSVVLCPASVTGARGTYKTARYSLGVGKVCWMIQNSKEGTPSATTYSGKAAGERGYYYNLAQARTACPAGWRLPTDHEWSSLAGYINSNKTAADAQIWFGGEIAAGRYDNTQGWTSWDFSATFHTSDLGVYTGANGAIITYGHYFAITGYNKSTMLAEKDFYPVRCIKQN